MLIATTAKKHQVETEIAASRLITLLGAISLNREEYQPADVRKS